MKGIIFDLLEQVVSAEHGDATWEALLDATGLEGTYTAVGSYPDDELFALIGAATKTLGVDQDDLVRWFGRACMPHFVERYPSFFEGHADTRSFLLTLNEVIHPEVRKLFPGAYAPSFELSASTPETIAMAYHSHRQLCSFAEGLIEGAAAHYGDEVALEQSACTKRGDERCVILATLSRP